MECLAAIDIGSNAIRLIVGTVDKKNYVKVLKKQRQPLRLGQDVFSGGRISESSIVQLQLTIQDFLELCSGFGVKHLRVVATSALRESLNKEEVLSRVFSASQIQIETIDYVEEAELISTAVKQSLDLAGESGLIFDIGGGSIEFIYLSRGQVKDVASFPFGTVRILNKVKNSDDYEGILQQVDALESELHHWLGDRKRPYSFLVGTGGNLECIGGLRRSLLGKKSDRQICSEELDILIGILSGLNYKQRRMDLGLRQDRADVLIPAVLICRMVFTVAQKNKLCIPRVGLRDGLMLNLNERSLSL